MGTKSIRRSLAISLIADLLSVPAAAQWIKYPSAGVPHLPDGTPNLAAPTPRAADGKPDLSGIWAPRRQALKVEQGSVNIPPQMANIADGLEGGLPYQPWARALAETRQADKSKDLPSSRCLPLGPLLAHTYLDPRKIVQTPGLLVLLNERDFSYRQIFIDGRPLPEDPNPSWNGYSTAAWEGDTLVVRTIGFRDDLWLDTAGSPLTEAGKMTERIRRPNFGTLEVQITIDDPKAYTRPWTVQMNQAITLDTELIDEMCLENEKSSSRMKGK